MTEFGNPIRFEPASRENIASRAVLLPENFASEFELSPASRRELNSLTREADPALLSEGLLRWAGREERDNRPASAALAYEFLNEKSLSLGFGPEVRERAQARLALLAGGGTVGERVEYQMSRFVREAGNPAFIAALATGSAVFSVARAGILAQLAQPGRVFIGARAVATAGAFSLEVPAVWAAAKGVTEVMAPGSQSWSADQNLRELASLGLVLGALKFCGAAMGGAVSWAQGGLRHSAATASASAGHNVLVQTGALAGIALGRQLEVAVGLQRQSDAASLAVDSLALLMQVRVGGRIAQNSLGASFQARSRGLESQARQGESLAWSKASPLAQARFAAGPMFRGQGPDMIGQGPDMIRPTAAFGQGPDMIRPAGQGPDMIRPALFGQGPDMRAAL